MTIITIQHIESCFCIKGEGGVGTCFAINYDDTNWLVTAKHTLGGAQAGGLVYLRSGSGWESKTLARVISSDGDDVSVFLLERFDVEAPYPSHEPQEDPVFGQELKFLGFPHGLANAYEGPLGLTTPLCRNAFFSGVISRDERQLLVLDGFNNPGYSGAPVWYGGGKSRRLFLLGVVSGYRVEERSKSRVYRELPGDREEPVEGLFVKPNSGMIHAVPYKALRETIESAK